MARVFVNIGSNLGDRLENLEKAISMIAEAFGEYKRSRLVESDPWGFESTNSFYNIGIAFESEADPEEILLRLQEIEKRISPDPHRDSEGKYIDRIVDIDIMAIEGVEHQTSILTLPHPHLHDRDFFLIPYLELMEITEKDGLNSIF